MTLEYEESPAIYTAETSSQFRKDIKKAKKQNRKMEPLKKVMETLLQGLELDQKHKDHPLVGNWKGSRECHITPDWLLIYTVMKGVIRFERVGSHSSLFG